jgi:acetylornithine/N-succinyldiaminopimelate aminotransferase
MVSPVLPKYARADHSFESGEGVRLDATNGERYLDIGSGVAVNALGHAQPRLDETITEQARKMWHTSNL